MPENRIALVTGASQGMGRQVATELAADDVAVYVGCRDLARGEEVAAQIGPRATALQLDVTDAASIAAAADRIRTDAGRLDLLVNNAGISTTRTESATMAERRAAGTASTVSIEEVRGVWEVNVFGVLAVYQAMLPLLRLSSDARIVNVTSALGSLTLAANPDSGLRSIFDPVYSASKTALHAVTMAMMIELEKTDIKVNLVSPGFARTALVNFEGTDSIEDASRETVRVARLGPDGPTGTFTTWEGVPLPW